MNSNGFDYRPGQSISDVHGLTVVTRNVRHFEPTGAPVLDPSTPAGDR